MKHIKNLFRQIYKNIINKLRQDFDINEQLRLTHHIIAQLEEVKKEQIVLKNQINTCNVFLTGIPNKQNELYQKMNISLEEITEVEKTINGNYSDVHIINKLKIIEKIGIKNKSVLLIGAKNNLYIQGLIKMGVQKIKRIEASPFYNSNLLKNNEDVANIFPTQLDQLNLGQYDILIIADKYFSSLIVKNYAPFLGSKIKEKAIMSLNIKNSTIYEESDLTEIFIDTKNNLISFNDNYARKKIHAGGFFEISDSSNYKITQFNYIKGYKTVLKQKKGSKKINNPDGISEILYIAHKLPQTTS